MAGQFIWNVCAVESYHCGFEWCASVEWSRVPVVHTSKLIENILCGLSVGGECAVAPTIVPVDMATVPIGTNYFVQEFKRRSRLFVFQLLLFILLLTFVAFTHESLLKQRRCQKSLDIISERRLWLTNSRDIHFVSFKRNWVAKKRKKHSIVRVLVKI